jgi:hypothetical protein
MTTNTNFQYNGVDISNIVQGYKSSIIGYTKNTILNMGLGEASTQFNSVVDETVRSLDYKYGGTDISTYLVPRSMDITTTRNVTVPSGCYGVGVILVGGGGGGGTGTANTYTYNAGTAAVVSNDFNFCVISLFRTNGSGQQNAFHVQEQQGIYHDDARITSSRRCPSQLSQQLNNNFLKHIDNRADVWAAQDSGQAQSKYVFNKDQIHIINTMGRNNGNTYHPDNFFGDGRGLFAETQGYQTNVDATTYKEAMESWGFPHSIGGYQGYYSTRYVAPTSNNSGSTDGQAGNMASYVYIKKTVTPGDIITCQIGSGGSIGTTTDKTSGGSTTVKIGGINYVAGGGDLASATTTTGVDAYSTTALINSISNSYNYGRAGGGGAGGGAGSGTSSNTTGGQDGQSGQNGFVKIHFFSRL